MDYLDEIERLKVENNLLNTQIADLRKVCEDMRRPAEELEKERDALIKEQLRLMDEREVLGKEAGVKWDALRGVVMKLGVA